MYFRTLVSVMKLCHADQAVREYLLYVLDSCWRAQKRVDIPEGLPRPEHTPEQWQALGHSLASTQVTQFWMFTAVEGVLQYAPSAVWLAQPMQGLPNELVLP